tara:strand:+ start:240 stop:704 length:465 start_codon:yes stop_codon:yes gene_type:complete
LEKKWVYSVVSDFFCSFACIGFENLYIAHPDFTIITWKMLMSFYESTFVARQDVSAQEVEKITEKFSKVVDDHGGKVIKNEYWGLRSLAYKIKKNRKGHYVMLCLDAPADAVNELERQYKLSEDIIRNLTIKVDEISNEPSAPLRSADKKRSEG